MVEDWTGKRRNKQVVVTRLEWRAILQLALACRPVHVNFDLNDALNIVRPPERSVPKIRLLSDVLVSPLRYCSYMR